MQVYVTEIGNNNTGIPVV